MTALQRNGRSLGTTGGVPPEAGARARRLRLWAVVAVAALVSLALASEPGAALIQAWRQIILPAYLHVFLSNFIIC